MNVNFTLHYKAMGMRATAFGSLHKAVTSPTRHSLLRIYLSQYLKINCN